MDRPVQLLLISGSLRSESTNTAVLQTARVLAPDGVATVLCGGMGGLPHFNPDDDREGEPVHDAVAELQAQVTAADGLLICAPEYAGALPGALKNLLEWTVGDAGTYRKPVGWINASGGAAPTGGAVALGDVSGERGDRRDDLLADLQVGDRPIRADGIAGDREPADRPRRDVGVDVAQHLAQGVMGVINDSDQ